jgi:DNA-binding transcriptional ArsR family regulator
MAQALSRRIRWTQDGVSCEGGRGASTDALGRLLGRTRALVLSNLDKPLSTTALAAMIALSPAGVSRHLLALRGTGLVSTTRHGHEVLYRRSELGSALLSRGREGAASESPPR